MRDVRLTKRIEFAAAHRYWRDDWDAAKNEMVFGASAREHGHNYMLEVTVVGPVDAKTGMVVNLYDLKRVLKELLEEFDHKHLNRDTPYFKQGLPTGEHVAGVLWQLLSQRREIGRLERVRLSDDENGCVDVTAGDMADGGSVPAGADVVRRYPLDQTVQESIPYAELMITVHGPLDPDRGQVLDPEALDNSVKESALPSLLRELRSQAQPIQGIRLTEALWSRLAELVPPGALRRLRLIQSQDQYLDYAG
jgi:6-pyruvoyltetrahydropterin/6-carboxytetrahydropterin synthase